MCHACQLLFEHGSYAHIAQSSDRIRAVIDDTYIAGFSQPAPDDKSEPCNFESDLVILRMNVLTPRDMFKHEKTHIQTDG